MKKYKYKKDIINLSILSAVVIMIILFISRDEFYFGSVLDWENQHWIIPEYFRTRFYETKEFFPSYAMEMGAGQNIYNLSYYGLLNPLILLSYCMPFIDMRTYIIGINIILVVLGVCIIYVFLRRKYEKKASFVGAFLYAMASPILFHSHRHFMFIDYMVFMIGGMIAIRYYYSKKRIVPFIILSFLIIMTSFYFSIGCFVAFGIYTLYLQYEMKNKIEIINALKNCIPIFAGIVISVVLSAVLLLPTAYALMGGRESGGKGFDFSSLIPSVHGEFLLFDSYSIGLSTILILAIIWALIKKNNLKMKIIAVSFIIVCVFPVFVYIMNGFMYLNGKVLIPFIPLGIILITDLVNDIIKGKISNTKKITIITFIVLLIIAFTSSNNNLRLVVIVEGFIAISIFNINKKAMVIFYIITSFAICLTINMSDKLEIIDKHKNKLNNVVSDMVNEVIEEDPDFYRFANEFNMSSTVNKVYRSKYYQSTIYSSVKNHYFWDFYFKQMYNENSYRNSALIAQSKNVLFDIYMNNKYLISESSYIPVGYTKVGEKDNIYLYKNEDVFSFGYGNGEIIKRSTYDNLEYPYNVEALMKYTIIDDKVCSEYKLEIKDNIKSALKKCDCSNIKLKDNFNEIQIYGNTISVNSERAINTEFDIGGNVENKIYFISFDVDNNISKKTSDVWVTINGIKNKLTKPGWKYHNENYRFEYVVSLNEEFNDLDITFSSGTYNISNIKAYELDYNSILNNSKCSDKFIVDKNSTYGDIISGSIESKKDQWFNISIPYDEGYTVKIDDREVTYYKTDIDFIGFYIEKGNHKIVITYSAPLLLEGGRISGMGIFAIVILSIIEIYEIIKKRRKRVEENK